MRLSYKSQIPNPPSYPTYDVKRVYPEFSGLEHCIGWGKGERQGIFHKVVQFYESTQKLQIITNIALLSQGLLCSRLKLFICLRIPTKLSIARGRYFQGDALEKFWRGWGVFNLHVVVVVFFALIFPSFLRQFFLA